MTENPMGFSSPSDDVSRIELLIAIARMKGSLLSAKDVDELTSLLPAGSDLESIWTQVPKLDSKYEVQGDLLLEKQATSSQALIQILEGANQRRARAERYVEYARQFSYLSRKRWIRVLSVAGSTSYKATSENDDLDIFCVTEQDSAWIYLTKALILARAFRIVRPKSPRFCFSCVLDEQYAVKLFSAPNDALFARDALTIRILQGSSFYDSLLQRGQWIADYFPKLHRTRRARHVDTQKPSGASRPTAGRKALNHFLFLTVGNYVKVKSILLNKKLRKRGVHGSSFNVESSRDHCIFESQSYQDLRRMYAEFKPSPTRQLLRQRKDDPR